MKKAGITCDNYKVTTFKKHLKSKGFDFSVQNGITLDTKIILVKVPEDRIQELKGMIASVELGFQGRQN